jgi:predicted membrane-bound mannosyltransferase
VGISTLFFKRISSKTDDFFLFIALFTVITTVIYCLIPYKTPWSMLCFFQGWIMLAAYGARGLYYLSHKLFVRILITFLLAVGSLSLAWQSYQLNFKYDSHPNNPYVYSHPGNDVLEIEKQMEKIANSLTNGYDLYIQVIFPESDYWPLPWYFRKFNQIGWWDRVDPHVPVAPILFISPQIENDLTTLLYEKRPPGQQYLYIPLLNTYRELRPGAEIHGYIQYDLWNRIITNQNK